MKSLATPQENYLKEMAILLAELSGKQQFIAEQTGMISEQETVIERKSELISEQKNASLF